MHPVEAIIDYLRKDLTPYPADDVSRIGAQMGDAVLWSGPARLQSTVDGYLASAAYGYLLMLAGALGVVGVFYALYRYVQRHGEDAEMPSMVQMGFISALFIALGSAAFGGVNAHVKFERADAQATKAVIVTASRIIEIDGDARSDIPASAITRVSRRDSVIYLDMADRRNLYIETVSSETARLGQAMEKVVDAAGSGSRILKDRLG